MDVYIRQNICKLLTVVLCCILFYPLTCLTQFLGTKSKIELSLNLLLAQVVLFQQRNDPTFLRLNSAYETCVRPSVVRRCCLVYTAVRLRSPRTTNCCTNARNVNVRLYIALWIHTKKEYKPWIQFAISTRRTEWGPIYFFRSFFLDFVLLIKYSRVSFYDGVTFSNIWL
jgi:hypothetical protein